MDFSNFQAFDNLNTEIIILDGDSFGLVWMNEAAKAAHWTEDSTKLSGKKISSLLDKESGHQINEILQKTKKNTNIFNKLFKRNCFRWHTKRFNQIFFSIRNIYATEDWYYDNCPKINDDILVKISSKELSRISNLKSPNNVLAVVKKRDLDLNHDNLTGLTLVLDSINDPGNLGTIIRSCHWFSIMNIVCSENTVDMYNSKVIQSTMGSVFNVNVFYKDLSSFLKDCSNSHTIYGSFLDGDDIKNLDIKTNSILVVGNESNGISNSSNANTSATPPLTLVFTKAFARLSDSPIIKLSPGNFPTLPKVEKGTKN